MKTSTKWKVSDVKNAKYLGIVEIETKTEEPMDWEVFDLLETKDRVVFGGSCNVGFIESGYILKEDYEHVDETLHELVADLETYYQQGPEYVSRIVCNERM